MTELPYVDSFDPEEKDGWASPSTSESSATTFTLTPLGAQYSATQGRAEKGSQLRYGAPASPCDLLRRLNYHS